MNDKELEECAEIEYQCWRENFSPMLKISEILYYQTVIGFKKNLEVLLKSGTYKPHSIIIYDSKFEVVNRARVEVRTVSGFAVIQQRQNGMQEYVVEKFFVSPKHQGRGIGQKLLEAIIDNFSDKSISVSVFEQNRIAQHLLIKNGFEKTLCVNSKITYGKNEINVKNVYYKWRKNNERDIL